MVVEGVNNLILGIGQLANQQFLRLDNSLKFRVVLIGPLPPRILSVIQIVSSSLSELRVVLVKEANSSPVLVLVRLNLDLLVRLVSRVLVLPRIQLLGRQEHRHLKVH